jgi:dipeptidyl aminopeptidase/acylaminoacyl peptidase
VAGYRNFVPARRFQPSVAISPDGTFVAYSSNASGQFNLCIQPSSGGEAIQLTRFDDQSVREITWQPDGTGLFFTADADGDEQYQVYWISIRGGEPMPLTDGGQWWLAEQAPFGSDGRFLLTAANDRDPAVRDLVVHDLADDTKRRFPGPSDKLLFPAGISPDGRYLLAGALTSNTDCQCYLADMDHPERPMRPITAGLPGQYYYPGPWSGDSAGFYVRVTGGDAGHVGLSLCTVPDPMLSPVDTPPWDVEDVAASADGQTVAWLVNDNGRSVLHVISGRHPLLAPELPAGVIRAMSLSRDGHRAAVLLDSAARPAETLVLPLGEPGEARFLTDTRPPGLHRHQSITPEQVSYPSGDGTSIPGLLYRPRVPGKVPVLLHIHGGPEMQARSAYDALTQCLLASGIAVFMPNVRGSAGYGQWYQQRIYRDWGGIDLADFATAVMYLKSLEWVAAGKIAVYGSSYGGFAALSCLSRLPELEWAAGVSVCGPSNLQTLVRSVPPAWRALMADAIGDPDRDADLLRERSPVTYAGAIIAPLFLVQSAHDPRVPRAESDQIAAKLRAAGVEVRYDVYEDEGHGFTSRDNELRAMSDVADFLIAHLL